jgi:hypothetical protein
MTDEQIWEKASNFFDEHSDYDTIIAFARAIAKLENEEMLSDFAQALCEDCENGVKWLNEQAVLKFHRDFPSVSAVLDAIRARNVSDVRQGETT